MNPLSSLVTFASVVEHRSFSRAAEHLDTTHSSVSKQIAKLEAHLKIKLLHRSTRTLAPTDAGNLIYQHCVRIVKEAQAIHTMLDEWQANPSGALKVIASAAIGRSFLSADYLAAQGTPRSLSDLQQHNCLLFNNAIVSRPSRWTLVNTPVQGNNAPGGRTGLPLRKNWPAQRQPVTSRCKDWKSVVASTRGSMTAGTGAR